MELKSILRSVMLFASLSDDEIEAVATLCNKKELNRGDVIAEQGAPGDELYIIAKGFAEVAIESGSDSRVVVNLGQGQIIGEMSLVDQGPRSATVRAISDPTIVQIIRRQDFDSLCERNTRIGYIVMKDIAADLSFKLRHRNLTIG